MTGRERVKWRRLLCHLGQSVQCLHSPVLVTPGALMVTVSAGALMVTVSAGALMATTVPAQFSHKQGAPLIQRRSILHWPQSLTPHQTLATPSLAGQELWPAMGQLTTQSLLPGPSNLLFLTNQTQSTCPGIHYQTKISYNYDYVIIIFIYMYIDFNIYYIYFIFRNSSMRVQDQQPRLILDKESTNL